MPYTVGGHWFFLPGINCWQMGRWALPKPIMAELSLSIRQVARLLRSLHDTFAEVRMAFTCIIMHHVLMLPAAYTHVCTSVLRASVSNTTATLCTIAVNSQADSIGRNVAWYTFICLMLASRSEIHCCHCFQLVDLSVVHDVLGVSVHRALMR